MRIHYDDYHIFRDSDDDYYIVDTFGHIPPLHVLEKIHKDMIPFLAASQEDLDNWNDKRDLIEKEEHEMFEKQRKSEPRGGIKLKGYIYIIKSHGRYKIGKTKHLNSRIKKYITENPHEIDIVKTVLVEDYTAVEIQLHEKFTKQRVPGRSEWYEFTDKQLIKVLQELKKHELKE